MIKKTLRRLIMDVLYVLFAVAALVAGVILMGTGQTLLMLFGAALVAFAVFALIIE